MRLSTRSFLGCSVPFILLLVGQFLDHREARGGKPCAMACASPCMSSRSRSLISIRRVNCRIARFLRVVGENAALKAGLQLILSDPSSADARRTVEDQLRELCESVGFDLLLVFHSFPASPWPACCGTGATWYPSGVETMTAPGHGFYSTGGRTYQVRFRAHRPG